MDVESQILAALSILDDRIAGMQDTLDRFTNLLDRFLPLLEKYEQGGPLGMLLGNGKRRETVEWQTPK